MFRTGSSGQGTLEHVKRRAQRYVPNAVLAQCLLDVIFVGAGLTAVIAAFHDYLRLAWPIQLPLVTAIAFTVNIVFMYASGCYRRDTIVNSSVARARLPVTLGLGAFVFFIVLHYGLSAIFPASALFRSASMTGMLALVGASVTLTTASASRIAFYAMVRGRWFRRRILVVGTGQRALYLYNELGQNADGLINDLLFAPDSIIDGATSTIALVLRDAIVPVGSRPIDVLARDLLVDEIVIAVDDRRGLSLERLLACKANGIPITDYSTFFERETGRIDLNWLEPSWLVYSNGFQMRSVDVLMKRFLDISLSLFMLILSAPVLIIAIVAIRVEGRGKIFYSQTRITQDGRPFSLYKLRTMREDAERLGPQWAAMHDPRITCAGKLLRHTHIDEIPQLLNVLRGDMSLVGPRPERPVFVEQLSREIRMYDLRHKVKSGLTGWAQINFTYGASTADAERKLEYDLYYIKNYSLLRDFLILLQTLWVLIWPPGVR
jgi:sugar transferase (PEP-CTERM system associated)